MSGPSARTPSFRDAGLEQPVAQSKSSLPFRSQKARGRGAPGADTALHSPSGEGCGLRLLTPGAPFNGGQAAPSKGQALKQTRGLRGRNHSPGEKHLNGHCCLTLGASAREQKRFFPLDSETESEIDCRSLPIFTWPP